MLAPNDTLSKTDRAILAMTPADVARFWLMVDKTPGQGPGGECWGWTGSSNKGWYGWFRLPLSAVVASRVAFSLANGHLPPPDKPCALHTCDWPLCVRGDHLWAGTVHDNNADMKAKGRAASGDRWHMSPRLGIGRPRKSNSTP